MALCRYRTPLRMSSARRLGAASDEKSFACARGSSELRRRQQLSKHIKRLDASGPKPFEERIRKPFRICTTFPTVILMTPDNIAGPYIFHWFKNDNHFQCGDSAKPRRGPPHLFKTKWEEVQRGKKKCFFFAATLGFSLHSSCF